MAEPKLRLDPADRIRSPPRPRVPRQRARGKGFLRRASKLGLLVLLWTAIVGSVVLGYFALTLPDTGDLTRAERRPSVTILAADGSLLTTYGDLFGQPLTLREMSPYLPKAVPLRQATPASFSRKSAAVLESIPVFVLLANA